MKIDQDGFVWNDDSPDFYYARRGAKGKKRKLKEAVEGLLWNVEAERERTAPHPFWLEESYLPNLEEARSYRYEMLSDKELLSAVHAGDLFVWDTEFYPNYTLVGARHRKSRKLIAWHLNAFEKLHGAAARKCEWFFRNGAFVGFNSGNFDIPMLHAFLSGRTPDELVVCAEQIILGGMRTYDFYEENKISQFYVNDIDLIELTALGPGLKICAGRISAKRMADLPFKPGTMLSEEQKIILRWYWTNDLDNTSALYDKHETAIKLRELLGKEYRVDVRSKSDPQVAESIIRAEYTRLTGKSRHKKAEIVPGRTFQFKPPAYLEFNSNVMRSTLDLIRRQHFMIDHFGAPEIPDELAKFDIKIGTTVYRMGIGGLHSREKRMIFRPTDTHVLSDHDVTSYYPMLILQQGMYPPNIGPVFLDIFRRIVERRIQMKRAGDKDGAETLKIVVNGTFGKTGERGGNSIVYYPEMMIQVTLSGQLAILYLIETLELAGIKVVSANTDGIMVYCPKHLLETRNQIMTWWQKKCELELEEKVYRAIYSRDVNNYIAVYDKPDAKEKNLIYAHAKAVGAYRKVIDTYPLKWNPTCNVCSEAVINFLANGVPIEQTIATEKDVRKFIEVRRVSGGAVKDNEYLGKAIRWYYAKGETHEIINAKNGYMVPRSQGAKPCMVLPDALPADIDLEYYAKRAYDILGDFGMAV